VSEPVRSGPRVCFLGSTSYTRPLSRTQAAKWSALRAVCEPYVVALANGLSPKRFNEEAQFYLLPAIPLRALSYALLLTAGTAVTVCVIVSRRIDVVVAQGPYEGVAAAIARTLARMVGRHSALVVESHGNFETALLLGQNGWWTSLYRRIMPRAARFALRRADALRAISTATARQLGEWGCTQPIVSFPTWTEIEVFFDSPLRTTSAPTPTIVYAGVLTPLKGVDVLLRAFAAIAADFPDAQLRLIGAEIDARFAAGLRHAAADLTIAERVTFVGEVTQVELAGELARGSFLVLPSHSEGLGRVVLEAMATGRAVLATNVGGIPDLVEQGKTGYLVPAGDVDALRDRLAWLLRHPEECAEMGAAGRARVVDSYSTAAYIRGYAQLFDVALQHFHEDDAKTPVADIEPRHGR
jgi:glycosyltransferase involved in cell wall biosynthesis